jgi:hypothetical protein
MLAAAAFSFLFVRGDRTKNSQSPSPNPQSRNLTNVEAGTTTMEMGVEGGPIQLNVAQAVMVTEDFDFGPSIPSIAEAVRQIERDYIADDGSGRTFAILDAYGEPAPEGRLRISMHVSTEKPGMAIMKFKGKPFWRARIGKPGDRPAGGKNLVIYLADGAGGNYVLDGTRGGSRVLDVFLQNSQQRVRDVWPEGAEREVTFVYSACGCPVKVMARRVGDRTPRTKQMPLLFPDDPAAVATISNLMKW